MQPSTASPPPSVGVAVVEDSAMLRELIEEAIEGHPGLHLTGSARTMREAVSQIPWRSTQFATIDLQLPDGVGMELAQRVRASYPAMRVAILSDHRRPSLLDTLDADELRFWSYILKSSIDGRRQLGELLALAATTAYIDPRVISAAGEAELLIASLTDQQREILSLVVRGLSNSAIARQMSLADKSVEYHLRQIYVRLGLPKDTDANQRVSATVLYLQRFSPDAESSSPETTD